MSAIHRGHSADNLCRRGLAAVSLVWVEWHVCLAAETL